MGAKAAVSREMIGLPEKVPPSQGALFDENAGVSEAGGLAPAPPAREPGAPGRPPGSTNRDTDDMRRYLASLGYRPGQIALAELGGGGDLDQLIARAHKIAAALDCKPIEAFRLVLEGVKEFASYTGSKVTPPPAAVALPAGVVLIHATADQARQLVDDGLVFLGEKSPENGDILDVTPRGSDTSPSDTSPKPE